MHNNTARKTISQIEAEERAKLAIRTANAKSTKPQLLNKVVDLTMSNKAHVYRGASAGKEIEKLREQNANLKTNVSIFFWAAIALGIISLILVLIAFPPAA